MQFPEKETETSPVTSLPKVISCFTKRLGKLSLLQAELSKTVPAPPKPSASPEELNMWEKGIYRKSLCLSASPFVCGRSCIAACPRYVNGFHKSGDVRMLVKLQTFSDCMESLNEQLSALKTEGLVDGFHEWLASNRLYFQHALHTTACVYVIQIESA